MVITYKSRREKLFFRYSMKKIKFIAFVVILTSLAVGCKKDDDPDMLDGKVEIAQFQDVIVQGQKVIVELFDEFIQTQRDCSGVVIQLSDADTVRMEQSNSSGVCTFPNLLDNIYDMAVFFTPDYFCPELKTDRVVRLYRKATGYVTNLQIVPATREDGVHTNLPGITATLNDMDIPEDVNYIYLRFFISSSNDVSKTQYGVDGNSQPATKMVVVSKDAVVNNKITAYYDKYTDFSTWLNGFKGTQTYLACYVATAVITPDADQLIVSDNFDLDAINSGVGEQISNVVSVN